MSKLVNLIFITLFTFSIGIISPAVHADNDDNPNKQAKIKKIKIKNTAKKNQVSKTAAKFSDKDKIKLANYFHAHPLAGTTLPPGIAKNLARGKPLPPGIAKKVLPPSALALLPNYLGYEYLIAGKDVLLVNSTTRIIADIIKNALQ